MATVRFHKNSSHFKPRADYLLRDVEQDSDNRVEYTETRNMATNNPQAGWRVMAATAMNRDRLKEAAGIGRGGRQSDEVVGHFSISWNPEEGENVEHAEMVRFADFVMAELRSSGKAKHPSQGNRHQALYVVHNDTEHKHIHVLWNRVNHENGVMLTPSMNHLRTSRLAQKYEQQRVNEGKAERIYTPERVKNNKLRDQGVFVRYDGYRSRDQYERERAAVGKERVRVQKAEMASLKERQRKQREKHAREQAEHIRQMQERRKQLQADRREAMRTAHTKAAEANREAWQQLLAEHDAELSAFHRQEEEVREYLGDISEERLSDVADLGETFELTDFGKRRRNILDRHKLEESAIGLRQMQLTEDIKRQAERTFREAIQQLEQEHQQRLADISIRQGLEQSTAQARVSAVGRRQRAEVGLPEVLKKAGPQKAVSRDPAASHGLDDAGGLEAYSGRSGASGTKPRDLMPEEGAGLAAYQIDSEKERRKREAGKLEKDRERDRGDEGRGV